MIETDEEKLDSLLRYMEVTGDLRPLFYTLKLFIKLRIKRLLRWVYP